MAGSTGISAVTIFAVQVLEGEFAPLRVTYEVLRHIEKELAAGDLEVVGGELLHQRRAVCLQ